MVSPSSRRRAARYLVEEGLSNAAQACRALGLARSSYYLVGQQRASTKQLNRKIVALSEEHPRYGYRRITALLRRKGKQVHPKRVQLIIFQSSFSEERERAGTSPAVAHARQHRAKNFVASIFGQRLCAS
jgi:putative transposase